MLTAKRVKVPGWFKTLPDGVVYVGRSIGGFKRSPFHNPYVVGKPYTLAESRDLFRTHVLPTLDVSPLRGLDLACWCSLDAEWCHADDLLIAANPQPDPALVEEDYEQQIANEQ